MNVQEELLQERIDPALRDDALAQVAARALDGPASGRGQSGGSGAGAVHGYEVLTGGCWNRVIGVRAGQRELVFKISPHERDERIIREYEVLSRFAEETELPVPEPLYLDAAGELLPGTALVMSRLPGLVMQECFGMLSAAERGRIIDRIAEDLAELHTRRSRGFGGVERAREERLESWPDFWLPRFEKVVQEARQSGTVPAALLDAAEELRGQLRAPLEIDTESTMTHYDIWAGNVMIDVDAHPPAVSGYIDIPGFYADYARELSFAMLFGVAQRRFFERYLKRHSLDDGFRLRANIYNLKMNIKHIQMYPGAPVYLQGAEENLGAIRQAL